MLGGGSLGIGAPWGPGVTLKVCGGEAGERVE